MTTELFRRAAGLVRRAAYSYYVARLARRRTPFQYVFVLSHMRSGSSLLANVLCSHREICGIGETHITYATPDDLGILVRNVYWGHRKFLMSERYCLDKVLHDPRLPSVGTLLGLGVHWIVLVRQPEPTLKSLIHTFSMTETRALEYYAGRLGTLKRQARRLWQEESAVLLDYERVTGDTATVLQELRTFLALDSQLNPRYRQSPRAERPGTGDPSPRIRAGRILERPRELAVEIGRASLEQAEESYSACRAAVPPRSSAAKLRFER